MRGLWTSVPKSAGRWTRALACGLGAVLLVAASLHARGEDGAVVSLSVVPTSGRAQVVIGVDGAVSVRDFVIHDPERLVVDITGATLGVRKGGYDRVTRGGVLDVRYAQNQPNVVRIVLTLAGPRRYDITRNAHEIRIAVDGGDGFQPWRVGMATRPGVTAPVMADTVTTPPVASAAAPAPAPAPPPRRAPRMPRVSVSATPDAQMNAPNYAQAPVMNTGAGPEFKLQSMQQRSQQPPVTVSWEKANIRDVLAAFAAFSGRTIIPSKDVGEMTITAEIVNKPWDVAMQAILNANGLGAVEDTSSGIIIVNTLEALATRPRLETLTTRTVNFNYAKAASVAEALKSRLSRDCGTTTPSTAAGGVPLPASTTPLNCPVRGAVTADSLTNAVSVTDIPTAMEDLLAYAKTLDVRPLQVNIKAKIVIVNRTLLEELGLKYDIGTAQQHFNDLVVRTDPTTGLPETSPGRIFLGGNALSAIANASQNVPSAAINLVYSAAVGAFSVTAFVDAIQSNSIGDVQAEPSVTTLNYRTATLKSGQEVPIQTVLQGTGTQAGTLPRVTVTLRQTGIVLTVTPQITNNRQIMMVVHAEQSSPAVVTGEIAFNNQSIDNTVLVADGETAVMGGLTQTTVDLSRTGIPLLIDLPLIGRLFGHTRRNEIKQDLLILITPHIVDQADMTMEPNKKP